MNTSLGYAKKTLTNSNVLLSGGGDKALSEFIGSLNWDSTNKKLQYKSASSTDFTDLITFSYHAFDDTNYLPLSGGTLTGLLKINYGIATDEWASNDGAISIRNTSDNNPYTLGFAANNGGFGEIQAAQLGIDAVNLVLLKRGGNVGIATTTPHYKLDVRGDIYSSGYIRTASGFVRTNSSDSYVLLGGGGHAPLKNLQVSGTATSVTSLNVECTFIYATLTESATLGLSNPMSVGQVLTVLAFNNGSASITLTVPSAWKSLDGYSINIGALKFGEISILCYASGNYMVSSKIQ